MKSPASTFEAAAQALRNQDWEESSYEKLVSDASDLENLLQLPEYHTFDRRLTAELALLIKKSTMVKGTDEILMVNGAIIQQLRVMGLARDVIRKAEQAISRQNRDSKQEPEER